MPAPNQAARPARPALPLQLHRATVRTAAIAFWGLGAVVLASTYIGPDLHVTYPAVWMTTGLAWVGGAVCWFLPWDRIPLSRFLLVIAGGIGLLTAGVMYTGGARSHLILLYLVVVVFTASLMDLRVTALIALLTGIAATMPLIAGWNGFYGRSVLILLACMAICAYLPARVRKALTEENKLAEARREQLETSYLSTIEALAAALDAKDRHTEAHSRETAALSLAVGRRLGLKDEALRFLEYAALLHDIGKIGIPGYVLNKPGPLDAEEVAIMREHPVIGERILATVPFLAPIRPVVRAEHERWDGRGYPDGLSGTDIPIEARIIHACDALQAMSTDRAYRSALPPERILQEIRTGSGSQFDPAVAEALLAVIETGEVKVIGAGGGAMPTDRPVAEAHAWTHHLDAIQQLGRRLGRVISVEEVCHSIGQAITTLLAYDQCRIYLLEDDSVTLTPTYFSDANNEEYRGVTAASLGLKVGEGITGWVAETKRGVVIGDTEQHPKGLHVPGTNNVDESMVSVPVIFEDRLIGVIVVVKIGLHQYTGDHLRLLTILANQAAVSIANARLIERLAVSATTDPLTGLANRRAFEEAMTQRLASTPAAGFTVIMLDVDGLKQVNDARGHGAGDQLLRRVAGVLRSHLRTEDMVSRWGGDEFLVLLPGVDRVGALSLARRVGGSLLATDDGLPSTSVSIGVATFPKDGMTATELLSAADLSMYADKRQRAA